ncbi:hypothetical protein FRB99_008198, partial [Tulasnella sp. 403]
SSSGSDIGFSVLDREIELLSETLCIVETQIQSRIFAAKKRRNSLPSIHRLPTEILVEIFNSVAKDGRFYYYRWLGKLSLVCKLWATIIDQSPALWTEFDQYDPRLVDKIIAKSGNCSLSLCVSSSSQRGRYLLERLLPIAYRWKTADFIMDAQDKEFLQTYLEGVSAPKLKRLGV